MEQILVAVVTYLLLAIAALFVLLYWYFTRNFNYWKNLGIPYIEPVPFFGNLKEAVIQKIDIGNHLKNLYNENRDKPYVGFFSFDRPTLLVNDLDLVKNILVKDWRNFINHNVDVVEKVDPLFANLLFSLKGDRWHHVRTHFTPTFTSGKMKKMFHIVDNTARELDKYLDKIAADGSPVYLKDTMSRYTIDVISSCALGIQSNSLRNPKAEMRLFLRKIFENSVVKGVAGLFMFFAPKIQNFLRLKFVDSAAADFLRKIVWSTVQYREKNGIVGGDFLDSMMELRRKGMESEKSPTHNAPTFKLDGDEFVGECFAFYFGGFETTASTLTYVLYELALHPDIQSRLREEITEVLDKHNQELSYDTIQEMKYLDMVVSETLRLHPVLGFLDRVCVNDYQLPDPTGKGSTTLPAGTGVYISMLGIQLDPEFYPDPMRFDPERFTEENKQKRHNFAYLPFGEGPRTCIGMRFAFMQVKVALVHVLSNYEVSRCKDTPVPIVYDTRAFLLHSRNEIPLTFKRM